MNDVPKTFSFDLQRFDFFKDVSYPDIKNNSELSGYGISNASTSNASASAIDGALFWNSTTPILSGTFGNESGVFIDGEYESNDFSIVSGGTSTPASYGTVNKVDTINFKKEYTVGGTTATVESNSATFTNFPTEGSVKITSEVLLNNLHFPEAGFGNFTFSDAASGVSGAAFSLEEFVVTNGAVSSIKLNYGSLSTTQSLADGVKIELGGKGDLNVAKGIGDNSGVTLTNGNLNSTTGQGLDIGDNVTIHIYEGDLAAQNIGASANIILDQGAFSAASIGEGASINASGNIFSVNGNIGANAKITLAGLSSAENTSDVASIGGAIGENSYFNLDKIILSADSIGTSTTIKANEGTAVIVDSGVSNVYFEDASGSAALTIDKAFGYGIDKETGDVSIILRENGANVSAWGHATQIFGLSVSDTVTIGGWNSF